MKILQVGVGAFGKNHLRVWHELRQEVYAADLSRESLKHCEVYNISSDHVSTDYHDFLDVVDAVDVVTPADKHYPIVIDALNAGKPVFVEKPLAFNSIECGNLARLSRDKGIIVQIGHLYRYNLVARYIEDKIKKSELGKIRYIDAEFSGFKRARSDVGVLLTDGIHYIDLMNLYFGDYPKFVYAETRDHFGRGLDDLAILLMYYSSGLGKLEVGNIQPSKNRRFRVIGSEAVIIADNMDGQEVQLRREKHERVNNIWVAVQGGAELPFLGDPLSGGVGEPLKEELRSFLNHVRESKQPEMNAEVATNIVKIVETAYASTKEGRKIEFEPFKL